MQHTLIIDIEMAPSASTPTNLLSGTHPPADIVLDQHITRLIHEDFQKGTDPSLDHQQFAAFINTLGLEDSRDLANNFMQSKADQVALVNPYLALAGNLDLSSAFLGSADVAGLYTHQAARNRHLGLSRLEFSGHVRLCHPDNLLATLQQIADDPVNFGSEHTWPVLIRVLDLLNARRVIAQLNAGHVPIVRKFASLALREQVRTYTTSIQLRLSKKGSQIKKTSFARLIYDYALKIGLPKADALRCIVESVSRLYLDVYGFGLRADISPETIMFYPRFQYPGLQTNCALLSSRSTLISEPAVHRGHVTLRTPLAKLATKRGTLGAESMWSKRKRSRHLDSPSSDWSPTDSSQSCESVEDRILPPFSGRSLRSRQTASSNKCLIGNVEKHQSFSEDEADFLSTKDAASDDSSSEDLKSSNSSQSPAPSGASGTQQRIKHIPPVPDEEDFNENNTLQPLASTRGPRKRGSLSKPAPSQKRARQTRNKTGTESQFWSMDILDRLDADEPPPREARSPSLPLQNANARRQSPVILVPIFSGSSYPILADNVTSEADPTENGEDTALSSTAPKQRVSQTESSSTRKTRRQTGTKSEHFLGPPPSADVPSLRTRKGVSCLRVPPLSANVFGLIQEELADNPFHLLLAVVLLNKTRGEHAIPTFRKLIEQYPTPEDLAAADQKDVLAIIRHLGLQNQRARSSIAMAKAWEADPPTKGRRHRTMNYPSKGMHTEIKSSEIVGDDDEREAALEIAHLPACGPYAYDSWRIFCRDKFRGLADGWNGEGAAGGSLFEPEWMRVVPLDKELRAFLRWQWLKEGWDWDPLTGDKEIATEAFKKAVNDGNFSWDGEIVSDDPASASSHQDLQTSELSIAID